MTAAVLVGPGVVIGAFVMLHATTLLDRLTLAPTVDRSEPLASGFDHVTAVVTGDLAGAPLEPRAAGDSRHAFVSSTGGSASRLHHVRQTEAASVGEKTGQVKGRFREAVGDLTDVHGRG